MSTPLPLPVPALHGCVMFSWPRKLLFRYPPSQSEEAPSGERLRDVKVGIGVIAGKTV